MLLLQKRLAAKETVFLSSSSALRGGWLVAKECRTQTAAPQGRDCWGPGGLAPTQPRGKAVGRAELAELGVSQRGVRFQPQAEICTLQIFHIFLVPSKGEKLIKPIPQNRK